MLLLILLLLFVFLCLKQFLFELKKNLSSLTNLFLFRTVIFKTEFSSSEFLVVSPKDVVIARRRDEDDHVTWLLSTNQHRAAMGAVKVLGKRLKKHTLTVSLKKYILL